VGARWDWHRVAPELRERGHDPVAVDLPSEDDSAGWSEYTDTVVREVGDRSDLIVVGHSLGGFTAPLVCARVPVELLVLAAAMIPSPGETFADWWEEHRLRGERVRRRLLPRRPSRARRGGEAERTGGGLEGAARALAPRGLAGHADEVPPLPRRPRVPGRVGAPSCSRAPRYRARRD
jgi:pimeloyl-ACP methyl ester carboxylesterase